MTNLSPGPVLGWNAFKLERVKVVAPGAIVPLAVVDQEGVACVADYHRGSQFNRVARSKWRLRSSPKRWLITTARRRNPNSDVNSETLRVPDNQLE